MRTTQFKMGYFKIDIKLVTIRAYLWITAIISYLYTSQNMSQQDYENGLKVRTEVMGESFVKRAQDNTVPFTQPLQDWINEHAWGSTWQREGVLPRKYRSLVTIAFLTALKSPTELKGHIRGALNNGASVEEIQEVLLHSLPYCGAPATQEAFRAALEVINEYQSNP